ncbi:MAG: DUF6183 family protein [Acidimicrobiales bacterium]
MSPSDATLELIEMADIDELVRHIDRLCDAADWEEVVWVRDLSRKALERGRQLWAVASRAEYRLALSAPAGFAAATLFPGSGRFGLGPLPEVVASSHTWAEIAPHAPGTPDTSMCAYERVIHGDDLTGDTEIDTSMFGLPLALQEWEPSYPTAVYTPEKAEFPIPPIPSWTDIDCTPGTPIGDEGVDALTALASVWTTESNGRADAVAVEGDVAAALGAIGLRQARIARVDAADALGRMAWTAASGGAHGRRRGMATGRFEAWWTLAAVSGLAEDWPASPDELGAAANELEWYLWHAGVERGWSLRLAVHDPGHGLAWALACADERSA